MIPIGDNVTRERCTLFYCYGKYCVNGKLLSLIKDRRVSDLHEANTSMMQLYCTHEIGIFFKHVDAIDAKFASLTKLRVVLYPSEDVIQRFVRNVQI